MLKRDSTKKNRVTVEIMGDSYTLVGDSSPEYINMIVSFVEEELKRLRERQPRLARNRILVLALMNIAERYFQEQEKTDRLSEENRRLKRDLKAMEKHQKF